MTDPTSFLQQPGHGYSIPPTPAQAWQPSQRYYELLIRALLNAQGPVREKGEHIRVGNYS